VDNVEGIIKIAQRRMSDNAAAIRNADNIESALESTNLQISELSKVGVKDNSQIYMYYKLKDILYTQSAVLTAMIDYAKTVGTTRGSSLCFDENGKLREGLEEIFRFTEENGDTHTKVQETFITPNGFVSSWRNVRPIPQNNDFFENVWRQYRENKNIY
jgi:hypothetical protein